MHAILYLLAALFRLGPLTAGLIVPARGSRTYPCLHFCHVRRQHNGHWKVPRGGAPLRGMGPACLRRPLPPVLFRLRKPQ